jgi:hypothetical protein
MNIFIYNLMKSLQSKGKVLTKVSKKHFAKVHKIDYNLKEFDVIAVGGLNVGTVLKYLQHTDFHGTMAGFNHRTKFFHEHNYDQVHTSQMVSYKYTASGFSSLYNTEQSVFHASTIVDIKPELNQIVDDKGITYGYKSLILNTGLDQHPKNMPFLEKFINDDIYAPSRVFVQAPSDEFHIERNRRIYQMHKDSDFIVYLPEFPSRREAYDAWYLGLDTYFTWGIQGGTFPRGMKVRVITPNDVLFKFPFANEVVNEEISQRTSIETHFGWKLTDVEIIEKPNAKLRYATFINKHTKEEMRLQFGTLLVTPENKKRQLFENNDVANEAGEVTVNPYTLQHTKYPNIFSFGDGCDAPTTKGLYASLNQSAVLRNNLHDYLFGHEFKAIYKGYTSFAVNHSLDRQWIFSHYYNYVPALMNFWAPRFIGLFVYCLKSSLERQFFNKVFQNKPNYSYPYLSKNKYFRPLDENTYLKKNNIKREDIFIHNNKPPHLSEGAYGHAHH